MKNKTIEANGTEIRVIGDIVNEEAYISLTDIAKYKNRENAFIVIANWMRNYSTISFLGLWEQLHNPEFKPIEFDRFKSMAGDNAFTLTPQQWIKTTNAISIVSKSGRYGGTYAHTDAVNEYLISPTLSPQEMSYTYASEADVLNMALFGKTAAQWRKEHGIQGNYFLSMGRISSNRLITASAMERV